MSGLLQVLLLIVSHRRCLPILRLPTLRIAFIMVSKSARRACVLQVFVDGQLAGYFDRDEGPESLPLTALSRDSSLGRDATVVLDILVSAMGRLNFGCGWDEKGLTSGNVTLDGAKLGLRSYSVGVPCGQCTLLITRSTMRVRPAQFTSSAAGLDPAWLMHAAAS